MAAACLFYDDTEDSEGRSLQQGVSLDGQCSYWICLFMVHVCAGAGIYLPLAYGNVLVRAATLKRQHLIYKVTIFTFSQFLILSTL